MPNTARQAAAGKTKRAPWEQLYVSLLQMHVPRVVPDQKGMTDLIDPLATEVDRVVGELKSLRKALARGGKPKALPQDFDAWLQGQQSGAVAEVAVLVRGGALLPSAVFAERMAFTRQALSKALAAHRVFSVSHEGQPHFPVFFADTRLDRRQVQRVCQRLGTLPGGAKLQFFMQAKASLGGHTPVDALRTGLYEATLVAAEGFQQR